MTTVGASERRLRDVYREVVKFERALDLKCFAEKWKVQLIAKIPSLTINRESFG